MTRSKPVLAVLLLLVATSISIAACNSAAEGLQSPTPIRVRVTSIPATPVWSGNESQTPISVTTTPPATGPEPTAVALSPTESVSSKPTATSTPRSAGTPVPTIPPEVVNDLMQLDLEVPAKVRLGNLVDMTLTMTNVSDQTVYFHIKQDDVVYEVLSADSGEVVRSGGRLESFGDSLEYYVWPIRNHMAASWRHDPDQSTVSEGAFLTGNIHDNEVLLDPGEYFVQVRISGEVSFFQDGDGTPVEYVSGQQPLEVCDHGGPLGQVPTAEPCVFD